MKKINCIMLVDDDEPTNFLNKLIISELNPDICICEMQNSAKALQYLREKKINTKTGKFLIPDLILLDLNMPGINGWEFLEEFRKIDKAVKGKTKIFVLTSSINPEDIEKSTTISELSGYLTKPLTETMVTKIIEDYFS